MQTVIGTRAQQQQQQQGKRMKPNHCTQPNKREIIINSMHTLRIFHAMWNTDSSVARQFVHAARHVSDLLMPLRAVHSASKHVLLSH